MLLVLEIFLTVAAWRKGWKGYALLPCAITFLFGFLMALAVQSSGGSISPVSPIGLVVELINIGVLIRLAAKVPKAEGHYAPVVSAPSGT